MEEDGISEMATRDSKHYGRPHVREEAEVYRARNDAANEYIKQGLTYKHAWWRAFQDHPRIYLDDPVSTPPASKDNAATGFVFPSKGI